MVIAALAAGLLRVGCSELNHGNQELIGIEIDCVGEPGVAQMLKTG
jgi:hypothetical protein